MSPTTNDTSEGSSLWASMVWYPTRTTTNMWILIAQELILEESPSHYSSSCVILGTITIKVSIEEVIGCAKGFFCSLAHSPQLSAHNGLGRKFWHSQQVLCSALFGPANEYRKYLQIIVSGYHLTPGLLFFLSWTVWEWKWKFPIHYRKWTFHVSSVAPFLSSTFGTVLDISPAGPWPSLLATTNTSTTLSHFHSIQSHIFCLGQTNPSPVLFEYIFNLGIVPVADHHMSHLWRCHGHLWTALE